MALEDSGRFRSFPVTHWTMVAAAGSGEEGRRKALEDLLRKYLPALKSHLVVRKRLPTDRAEDLLQAFVSDKILQKNILARADRRKGKFRTFLLTALDRFAIDQARREAAGKRSPGEAKVDLDDVDPAALAEDTRVSWDVMWAREVLAQALAAMRAECEAARRPDLWGVFRTRILDPILAESEPMPYDRLVQEFHFRSPVQASNALVTAKRMFVRNLREVVGEYADDEREVDEEIEELKAALSRAPAGAGGAPPYADPEVQK